MNNDQGYCGFADWPPCADLATTGVNGDAVIGIVLLAIVVIAIGAGIIAGWRL